MILGSYWLMREREAREMLESELQWEREARLAAEARASAAEARLATYRAAQTRSDASQRRSDKLMAVLAAVLKDKGVDPDVVDALLEE